MKKFITPIISACVLAMGISASAATIESVVVSDLDNSKVTVTGTVGENEKGVSISIEKQTGLGWRENADISYTDVIVQPTTITVEPDGKKKFSATFRFNAPGIEEGVAGVSYNVFASNNTTPYNFLFVDRTSVLDFVNKLALKQIPVEDIYSELLTYGQTIGVDISFADNTAKQEYLSRNVHYYSERILKNRETNALNTDAEKIAATKQIVNLTKAEIEFMAKLPLTVAQTGVHDLVMAYATSAEIDISVYKNFLPAQYTRVCSNFVGAEKGTYTDMKTFRINFGAAVALVQQGGGVPQVGGEPQGSAPSGNATSSPMAAAPSSPSSGTVLGRYNDLAGTAWATDAIKYVVEKGIMQGTSQNTFEPDTKVTREQVAKIITEAFSTHNANATASFADIPSGHWSLSYIGSVFENGLMNGKSNTSFGIGEKMTRQDLCTVLYRAAQKKGYVFNTQKTDFADFASINQYAQEAVSYLAGVKVINGMGNNMFAPSESATRAQTAQMVMKMAQLLGI